MKEIIVEKRELSADEKVRQEAYYREKRLHDEATALGNARCEGMAEGEAKGRAEGAAQTRKTIEDKLRQKGFSEEEIKELLGDI